MSLESSTRHAPAGGDPVARLFLLDNYDSFTFNLVQYFCELGAMVDVARNDRVTPQDVAAGGYDGVVISPGPGVPQDAGVSEALIRAVSGRTPLLGVCLGHQALGEVFGARVVRAPRLMHGKTSPIEHDGRDLFAGLPRPFTAGRYHSLVLAPDTVRSPLELSAWTTEGEVMGIRHLEHPSFGVQFHPESILTGDGMEILAHFLERCGASPRRPAGTSLPARGIAGP